MQQYINAAILEARKSNMEQKHGCVIVYKGKIIAKGYNHYIDYYNHLFSIHAEVNVLMKLKKLKVEYNQCDMYVIRISNTLPLDLRISKPCSNCAKTIVKYGIRNIYYSINLDDNINNYKIDNDILSYKKTRSKK
jgi:deoxycytidylate deaminase